MAEALRGGGAAAADRDQSQLAKEYQALKERNALVEAQLEALRQAKRPESLFTCCVVWWKLKRPRSRCAPARGGEAVYRQTGVLGRLGGFGSPFFVVGK